MMPTIDDICGRPTYTQALFHSHRRVTGGEPCQRGACPWQAALIYDNAISFCGGSVIDHWHILTAAHCFKHRNVSRIRVLLGKTNLLDSEDSTQTHVIADLILHEEFNRVTLQNDIAILRTKRIIEFNAFVIPVCLPKEESNIHLNSDVDAFVSGWGLKKNDSSSSSNSLHVGAVSLKTMDECQKRWKRHKKRYPNTRITEIVDRTTVCAIRDRTDSCRGDSGGPLISRLQTDHYQQIGIVSWGVKPHRCGGYRMPPGVYTNVMFHLDWIHKTIEKSHSLRSAQKLCSDSEFQCPNGMCIPQAKVCDGSEDCKEGIDEDDCHQLRDICGTLSPNSDLRNVYVTNPWMVIIFDKTNKAQAGGVIVDPYHVLTAPSGVFDHSAQKFVIRHGTYLTSSNDHSSIRHWEIAVESIKEKESLVILRLQRRIRFNDFLRPICLQPQSSCISNLTAVGWKEDGEGIRNKWKELSMAEVQSCECPNEDFEDFEEFDNFENEDEEKTGRFKTNACATDGQKGSYKFGDVLVKTYAGRAYLHGIINSESHYVFSAFSYTEISPLMTQILSNDMAKSYVSVCREDQLRCSSGICLDEVLICDGIRNCKDGLDEKNCQPILFPETKNGFQDMEARFKEIEVDNWKMKEEIGRLKKIIGEK